MGLNMMDFTRKICINWSLLLDIQGRSHASDGEGAQAPGFFGPYMLLKSGRVQVYYNTCLSK